MDYVDLNPAFYVKLTKTIKTPNPAESPKYKHAYLYVHKENDDKYLARILHSQFDIAAAGRRIGPISFSKDWLGERLSDDNFNADLSLEPIDNHQA